MKNFLPFLSRIQKIDLDSERVAGYLEELKVLQSNSTNKVSFPERRSHSVSANVVSSSKSKIWISIDIIFEHLVHVTFKVPFNIYDSWYMSVLIFARILDRIVSICSRLNLVLV